MSAPKTRSSRPAQGRALVTRARLLAAGRAAFAAKGLAGTNLTEDILRPSGVSAGSFYHQFVDKTDLLLAVMDEAAERRRAVVLSPEAFRSDRTIDEVLRDAADRFLQSLDEEAHDWTIQLRERANPDPRIATRVAQGRETWKSVLTHLLGPFAEAGADLDGVLDLFIAFFVGLTATYLDLSVAERSAQRRVLPERIAGFLLDGVRSQLDPRSPRARRPLPPAQPGTGQ